jgi:hypothetical protein
MKRVKRLTVLCGCALILLAGCTKYGTAVSTITATDYENKQLKVSAVITDDGGCDYYMEQGFCYSLFCPPSLTDVTSTQVKVGNYSEADTFSATFTLPLVDTAYYVCAYVKNSAGLSYSNAVRVSTNPLDYPAPEE